MITHQNLASRHFTYNPAISKFFHKNNEDPHKQKYPIEEELGGKCFQNLK
jgi:hypothetical protein